MINKENATITAGRERFSLIGLQKLLTSLEKLAYFHTFEKMKRQNNNSIINRAFWTVRTLLFWVFWISIICLVIWLLYFAMLTLVSLIVPEWFDYLPHELIAAIFDIALLVGFCEVFRRWLGTQPNPLDNP